MNTQIQSENRTCLNCQEPFTHGRADKIYCNESCRIDYGNKVKMENRVKHPAFIKTIQDILVNNYKVLTKLNHNGTTKIPKKKLEEAGFNFRYHTSAHTTKKGDIYYFCFNQGYLLIKDDFVLLVTQEDQVLPK